ncbi:Amidase 1-like protein [Drosera capensis]
MDRSEQEEQLPASSSSDHGAFMDRFILEESPSVPHDQLPLHGLTFAVKDIFDMEGRVTGFGNPDWRRTHGAAKSTAPAVLDILKAGGVCVGRTVMDEMAYSINGENIHYGTPTNPRAPDRIPGTDTGGSVRVPASFCGIFGFRPSHGVISVDGVVPMAQSFDTVGWFARDPKILNQVGRVLLLPVEDVDMINPSQVIIAEDCFQLLNIPIDCIKQPLVESLEKIYGGHVIKSINLGHYVKENVPSLAHFITEGNSSAEYGIPSLAALSSALRTLQRYEFNNNHGEWVKAVNPKLGPGISERVQEALETPYHEAPYNETLELSRCVMKELRSALESLLGDYGILALPPVPGPPPKLQMEVTTSETYRARAFSLLAVAGVSGFCQVSIPLGLHENLPVAVSLLAKHGSDKFLLDIVEALYGTLEELLSTKEDLGSS